MTLEQEAKLRAEFAAHIQRLSGMPHGFSTLNDRNIHILRRVAAAAVVLGWDIPALAIR